MEKEIRQLETALNELHKSNDVTRAAYSTLKFAIEQVKNCSIPAVIKSLPEYNEILYHARTLTDEQFREYWNEIQGNVL